MKLTLTGLGDLCLKNVVEIKFNRRRPSGYRYPHRRMLCTLDPEILFSDLGKQILNTKTPSNNPAYDAKSKNLLIVWDILMQDWRSIPVESVDVIATVPTTPVEDFWKYFDKVIRKMGSRQKLNFINK